MRHRKLVKFIAGFFIWLLGLAVIWWLIPVGPRDGWQPPPSEYVCGFLSDGRTLVSVPRHPNQANASVGKLGNGPIRLWDTETGELRGSYFSGNDQLHFAWILGKRDWLLLSQPDGDPAKHDFRIRLLEAFSGQELASFRCHVPDDNVISVSDPDSRMLAVRNCQNEQPRVELYELPSGKLLHVFDGAADAGGVFCFSPDGRRLAANRWMALGNGAETSAIDVWEVPEAKQIASLVHRPTGGNDFPVPLSFSPDGRLLLDQAYRVWDVERGEVRFQISSTIQNGVLFAPDSKHILALAASEGRTWLSYYDATTGRELTDRRITLDTAEHPRMQMYWANQDHSLVSAGDGAYLPVTLWQKALAYVPGLELLGEPRPNPVLIIDAATGRIVSRANWRWAQFPKERYALVQTDKTAPQLWDIPPRRPLRRYLPCAGLWTAAFALLTIWRIRRNARLAVLARASPPAPSIENKDSAKSKRFPPET